MLGSFFPKKQQNISRRNQNGDSDIESNAFAVVNSQSPDDGWTNYFLPVNYR